MRRALVLSIVLSGCGLGDTCKPDTWRCAGDVLELCTPHGGGVYGDDYVHSSDPTWDPAASCGPNLCVDGTATSRAFCALATTPDPACATDGYACAGTTLVTCRDGYAIEREACASCGSSVEVCAGGLYASCQSPIDCAAGMTCSNHTCEQPCACAEGADCAVCHAADDLSPDPSNGAAPRFFCKAGRCTS